MTVENDRFDDELDDHAAVDMTEESLRLAEEAEAKAAKAAEADDEDDDDLDDFDDLDDDPEDLEDEDDEDDEDDDEDEGEDDEEEERRLARKAKASEKRPVTKAQKRIKELATKRREAEKAAFDAEMRAIELEQRIAALESSPATQAAPKPTPPDPKAFEYGEVDPKYIDAVVDYRLAEKTAEIDANRSETDQAERLAKQKEHYQNRLNIVTAEGTKRFGKKFEAVVNDTNFPGEVAKEILDSDFGVDISYYLAKNVDKLRSVSLMTPAERAKAFGRLEERFSARASAGKKRTKAPDTPGRKSTGKRKAQNSKYGPEDQDAFDRAFYGK